MKHLRINAEWLRTITTILTTAVLALLFVGVLQQESVLYHQQQSAKQQVTNHTETLTEIQDALAQTKADNAKQTLILCTLILGNSTNFTDTQRSQVETICKEKINQNGKTVTPLSSLKTSPAPAATQPSTHTTPTIKKQTNSGGGPPPPSNLDKVPVVGGLFKKLGI